MQAAPAFDFAPSVQLLLLGAALASLPLLWVWWRDPYSSFGRRMQRLSLLALFLCFDLVLFGAFTRLSDSGLGCPDWPGCFGKVSPLGASAEIALAQAQMPSGPVTHTKAWIEMAHRYFAVGLGALILALCVAAWRQALRDREARLPSPWWASLSLVWVCMQGAFGALTVSMRLFPLIVALHLMGGMILLALLCAQSLRYQFWSARAEPIVVAPRMRLALLICAALLAVQIFLGAWVSANYAVLACPDFPACQSSWWPPMDFEQGFALWRELGMDQTGQPITFAALTAIHYVHRAAALLLFCALLGLAAMLAQVPVCRKAAYGLAALTLAQVLTGIANVVFDWPLLAALLHTGGAAALVVTMAWVASSTRSAASAPVAAIQPAEPRGQEFRGKA